MSETKFPSAAADTVGTGMLTIDAADVTGTHVATANVQRSLPAASVVSSLVKQMALPENVPYGLRDEATGAFLDDEAPIGDQLSPNSKATVTPKVHLGAPLG